MKMLALTCCITLSAMLVSHTTALAGGMDPEIGEGDTRASVIDILGEPDGLIGGGDYEMLKYDRGTIELANGQVTSAELISEQEAAKRKTARLVAEEERRKAAEARAKRQVPNTQTAVKQKPAPAASKPKASEGELTPEQQAELDKRIAEGIKDPPYRMSKRKLRRYRRGRSGSQLALRQQQITDSFKAELAANQGR